MISQRGYSLDSGYRRLCWFVRSTGSTRQRLSKSQICCYYKTLRDKHGNLQLSAWSIMVLYVTFRIIPVPPPLLSEVLVGGIPPYTLMRAASPEVTMVALQMQIFSVVKLVNYDAMRSWTQIQTDRQCQPLQRIDPVNQQRCHGSSCNAYFGPQYQQHQA